MVRKQALVSKWQALQLVHIFAQIGKVHRFRDVSPKTVLSYLKERRLQYIVLFVLSEHMPRVTMEPIKVCQVI